MSSEVWVDVLGYEGLYEVSDRGRVRSLPATREYTARTRWDDVMTCVRRTPGKVLAGYTLPNGYRVHTLTSIEGVKTLCYVHVLVLRAFVGPCPEGLEGLHWDDVKLNNHLSNLRWGTRRENLLDRYRNQKKAKAKK